MKWTNVLEDAIVKCIRNGDFLEDYGNDDVTKCFRLSDEAQKYLFEVRKRYLSLSEAINCMGAEDFIGEEE